MESSTPLTSHPSSNFKWLIVIGILVFLLVISLTWNVLTQTTNKRPFSKTPTAQITPEQSDFFDSQITTVKGKITKVEGNKLSIENERGKTLDAKASSSLVGPAGINLTSSPSLNFELNKPATINFQAINSEYQVVSVIYNQNSPTPPQDTTITTPSSSPTQSQTVKLEHPMGIPNNTPSNSDKESEQSSPSPKP